MQPAILHPCACEICGAPVFPDLLSGEAIDAQPELTKHGETIYHWHHCNVEAPKPHQASQPARGFIHSAQYRRANAALKTAAG